MIFNANSAASTAPSAEKSIPATVILRAKNKVIIEIISYNIVPSATKNKKRQKESPKTNDKNVLAKKTTVITANVRYPKSKPDKPSSNKPAKNAADIVIL